MNKQKAIDTTKAMIFQKKTMLQKFTSEVKQLEEKRVLLSEIIKKSKGEMEQVEKEREHNQDLQVQDAQRDEYLKIKSQVE